ncbi:hypothetical protein E1I18_01300 [Mycoplasmopsis mucosicanis]|uniref:Protein G-related albumin-binding (GA) module domain-containing protein n=1 Tax=Mycoplasmopsis mucosicanis TaxID=458208 RepID=A0A507SRR6_9BACT|nr:GA module-containing protein [Mycoplasmopsis mucosicanis]TQC53951.1 hypothetical protein E1I18_01300 [Mycoplasmopsis mucosicanis]
MNWKSKKVINTLLALSTVSAAASTGLLASFISRKKSSKTLNLLKQINEMDQSVNSIAAELANDLWSKSNLDNAKEISSNAKALISNNKNIKDESVQQALKKLEQSVAKLDEVIAQANKKQNPTKEEALEQLEKLDNSNPKKQQIKDQINKPDATTSDLSNAVKQIDEALEQAKEKAHKSINRVTDKEHSDALTKQLDKKDNTEKDYLNIEDQVNKLIEKAKEKALSHINKLKDSDDKKALLKDLNKKDVTQKEIEEITRDAINILSKIKRDASKKVRDILDNDPRVEQMLNQINNADSDQNTIEQVVEQAQKILEDARTKSVEQASKIQDKKVKSAIEEQISDAASLSQLDLINEKIKSIDSLKDLINEKTKQELLNKILNLDITDKDSKQKLEEINAQIKSIKDNQLEQGVEDIISEIKLLEYPSKANSQAVKDLVKKVEQIKNDATLSSAQKYEKAKEEVGKILPTIKQKISSAKENIAKLSPSATKEANTQLDKTSLLERNSAFPNQSFDELDELVERLLKKDKDETKDKISEIGANKLSDEEKNKLKDLVDKTDNWAQMQDIIRQTEIAVAKKNLEAKAKLLPYPGGNGVQAIKDIIKEINDTVDSKEKVDEFDSRLKTLESKIKSASDLINQLPLDKQKELNDKLNKASTPEQIDEVINEAIGIKKAQEIKELKDAMDKNVDTLSYPDPKAKAKEEIKDSYKDINDLEQLKKIQDNFSNIENKILDAKNEIAKLPQSKQDELNRQLNEAHKDADFDALNKAIEQAKNSYKNDSIQELNNLKDLTPQQKEENKKLIQDALDADEIQRILDKAKLLEKIEQLKKVITPNEYALADDPDVKKVIDETIKKLKESIDGVQKDKVTEKGQELDDLKNKLSGLKSQIEGLTDQDVLDVKNTKKELAKQLASDIDDAGIKNTELYIKKAKLHKKASDLAYPNGKNSVAITTLNTMINEATQDNIANVESTIEGLPKKIEEAKKAIEDVKVAGNDQDGQRQADLNNQLSRAVSDDDFDQLKKDIEKAKTSSAEDYKNDLKRRLIEQVDKLNYPNSSNGKTEAKDALKAKINKLETEKLRSFSSELDEIGKKLAEAREKISKLSSNKQTEANDETSKVFESEKFKDLFDKIDKLKTQDKVEINTKIDQLNELSGEERTKLKNEVNTADSYEQMLRILEKARDEHLKNFIDKLPYPTNNGRAKQILKAEVIDTNNANDNSFDAYKKRLNDLKTAIEAVNKRIDELPFTKPDTHGRRFLKEKLDNATTDSEVNEIVKDELKQKIQKYRDIIEKQGDYPIPQTNQQKLKEGRLDWLPDTNEADLKKQIYETKRQWSAFQTINLLGNLGEDKKSELKAKIHEWSESDNNISLDQLEQKINDIDKVILEAIKEDLKAKIDKQLAYPDPSSTEAMDSKNALKAEADKATNSQQTNALYKKLNQLRQKISDLKSAAAPIVNAQEKSKVNKLIDGLTDLSQVPSIELEIQRALGKDIIDGINNLDQGEKDKFKTKIGVATDQASINKIVEEARKQAKFNLKKKDLKVIIDQIEYPNKTSKEAMKSIETLKAEVDALPNDPTKINELDKKVKDLRSIVQTLNAKLENIPYEESKPKDALAKLKTKIDSLTDPKQGANIVDDKYIHAIDVYKGLIKRYLGAEGFASGQHFFSYNTHEKDEFLTKLNKMLPNGYGSNGYTQANFEAEFLSKLKDLAKQKVDSMSNLSTQQKQAHKNKIDAVAKPTNPDQWQHDVFEKIKDLVVAGYQENYSIFIDSLPYPSDSELQADVTKTKEALKDLYTKKSLNGVTDITALESKLNELKTLVTNVKNSIDAIDKNPNQNKSAIKSFNKIFAKAETNQKLTAFKLLVENYKTITQKFNQFAHYASANGNDAKDLAEANKALDNLKNALWDKLASLVARKDQDNLGHIIDEAIELYKETKKLSGDILAVVSFLEDAKTKNTVAELQAIKNKIAPFKIELDKFWTGDKGNHLRSHQDWFNSLPNGVTEDKVTDLNQYRFLPYNLLIKKIRTRRSAQEVKHIVDVEVEWYKALIEFTRKYKDNSSKNIPNDVKDSLKHKILNLPAGFTKEQMERITKYLGSRTLQGDKVVSGFYDDAKHLLESISSNEVGGKESNKKHLKKLFETIGTKNPQQPNNDNVTDKIDSFRDQTTKFIAKFKEAKSKFDEFKAQYSSDPKVKEFQDKLDKVVVVVSTLNEQGAQNLIDEIMAYKSQLDNKKANIKRAIERLPYPNGGQSSKTQLKAKVDSAKSESELVALDKQIGTLSKKITDFVSSLSNIPYIEGDSSKPKTAIDNIKRALDQATSVSDVDNILPHNWSLRIREYKDIINSSFVDSSVKNNLLTRLNQTVPTKLGNNQDFPFGNYKEKDLKAEIIKEYKANVKSTVQQLTNLRDHDKNKYNDIIKRIDGIKGNKEWEAIVSEIQLINTIVNEGLKANYDWFIDNNLNYPSKNTLKSKVDATKQRIKNALTNNMTIQDKQRVESTLNQAASKIATLKAELDKVKGVGAGNQKDRFEDEFAQTDLNNLDALINKIRNYNNIVKELDKIKNYNDKNDLIGELSQATTTQQMNQIAKRVQERLKEIQQAKQEALRDVNAIPEQDKISRDIKQEYQKQLQNIDDIGLDQLRKISEGAKLEPLRKEARDYVDKLLGTANNPSESEKRTEIIRQLNRPEQSNSRQKINELKQEADEEFQKLKQKAINRIEQELLHNAASYFPSTSGGGKIWVSAEDNYYLWYKDEVAKQNSYNGLEELETNFLFGRYADSIRIRAVAHSMIEYLTTTTYIRNRHNSDGSIDRYVEFIKQYVEPFTTSFDIRDNDKDHGFNLLDFWRSLNLYIERNNSTDSFSDKNIREDIQKTLSLAAQVDGRKGDVRTPSSTLREYIGKSVISRLLDLIKQNYKSNRYTKKEVVELIIKLFTLTATDGRDNTRNKILALKNVPEFISLFAEGRSKGIFNDAELWGFSDKPEKFN